MGSKKLKRMTNLRNRKLDQLIIEIIGITTTSAAVIRRDKEIIEATFDISNWRLAII